MEPRKTPKPKLTAEAAYENSHLVARDLLDRINELLQDMPAPGDDGRPIHWGHVGDINHVNALLLQAVAFLDRSEQ
jgi:hypothetical protein